MPRALHAQHAAIGVGVRRIPLGRQRMVERETQAIGFPGLPSRAAQPCDRRHISAGIRPPLRNPCSRASRARKASRSATHGCAPPPPRSAPPAFRRHGPCARAKAPDHPACGCRARAGRAPPPTRRHRIPTVTRPGIEQQRARGGFQQHRAALPHVQRRQPPVSRLGPLGTPAQQRQHPEPPPMAPRPASRLPRPCPPAPAAARARARPPRRSWPRRPRPPRRRASWSGRIPPAPPAPPRQPGVPRPESPRTTRTAGTGA